jgi:hypothetical protein
MSVKSLISILTFLFVSVGVANAQVNEIVWGTSSFGGTHPVSLSSDVTGNLTNVGWFDFNLSLGPSSQEGRVFWDAEDGTIAVGMPGGNVTMQVGQEILIRVSNKSGGDIKNGDLVYETGSQGNRLTIEKCDITDASTVHMLGMATEDIDDNDTGFVTMLGLVRGDVTEPIDTSGFIEGDKLYMDTAGGWTKTHPSDPTEAVVIIGHVVKVHAETGTIYVVTHESFTLGNNFDGSMRQSVINQSTGTSAAAGFTAINDGGHRASFAYSGTNNSLGAEIASFYNMGYGNTVFINDGNVDFVWYSDPTDQHDFTAFSNPIMTLDAAGDLSVSGGVDVGGELTLGAVQTFTPDDTTPDVEGSSYWKTGSHITITDFDGGSYTAGQIFVLEVNHNVRIDCAAGSFWCGETAGAWFLDYTNGDILTWIYRSDGFWSILSEALRSEERTETFFFIGAEIAEANDVGVVRLAFTARFPTMTRFSCVATGGTTADLDVFIENCSETLSTCGATGATLAMSSNNALYLDTEFSDPIAVGGEWWTFNFGTITVAPEILQCEISYVTG